MKRFARHALNALVVVSLVLCLAATVLWVRSLHTTDVVAHRGAHLWQVVAGEGRVFVQRLAYATRTAEGGAELAPPRARPGVRVQLPDLVDYVQSPGDYVADWVNRPGIGPRPVKPPVPANWRWAKEEPPGWQWTVETAEARAATRPAVAGGLQAWLVDGRVATAAAASNEWPGALPVALRVGGSTSVNFDRKTGETRALRIENWLSGRTAWVPLWFVVAAAAALPIARVSTFSIRRLRARRRARDNRCLACGYDLTGNSSGICPECAARVAATHRS